MMTSTSCLTSFFARPMRTGRTGSLVAGRVMFVLLLGFLIRGAVCLLRQCGIR